VLALSVADAVDAAPVALDVLVLSAADAVDDPAPPVGLGPLALSDGPAAAEVAVSGAFGAFVGVIGVTVIPLMGCPSALQSCTIPEQKLAKCARTGRYAAYRR
jgi:hypothetical protein